MDKRKNVLEAQRKRETGGRLWLDYYNLVLYEKGLITEQERNKMALKIRGWQGPPH